jgi:hypothetical protein
MKNIYGKLTIPWMAALLLAAGWAAGSFFTYTLSFYYETIGWEELGMNPDDMAGYVSFIPTSAFLVLCFTLFAWQNWDTWREPWPKVIPLVRGLIITSLILAPAWICTAMYLDKFRHHLPGDGNWPAIGCLSTLALAHGLLLNLTSIDRKKK